MDNNFNIKQEKLKDLMIQYTSEDVIVAFSGGVDSSILLKMACECAKENHSLVYAVTMQTRLHPVGEISNAKAVAEEIGAKHVILTVDELLEAGIDHNPENRCYLCKKCLFEKIQKLAEELGINHILEGTNEDDLHVYRPGLKALKEMGIISPLAQAGMTKADVRQLAALYGLSVSNRPAMPCLATRFPYGTELSYEMMDMVAEGEEYLRSLGFYNVRVRVHGNIARIEVDADDFGPVIAQRQNIIRKMKALGYDYVTLDLEGFRSGSMDIHVVSDK